MAAGHTGRIQTLGVPLLGGDDGFENLAICVWAADGCTEEGRFALGFNTGM